MRRTEPLSLANNLLTPQIKAKNDKTRERAKDGCKRHVTFIPAANTDYEMLVGQSGMCSISVVGIARNGAPISPEPTPFQETAFCEDLE